MTRLPFVLLVFLASCTTPRQTTSDPVVPGGRISFVSNRDKNYEVYVMDTDGGNARNLSRHEKLDYWSSWSSDKRFLLFYSNRDGNNEIYRMNADGNEQVNLSHHAASDNLPELSPDDRRILFMSDRDHKEREIYVMQADGSQVQRLTHNELFEESPHWSPNGKHILFTRQLMEGDSGKVSNGEIFIMKADGTGARRLTRKPGYDSGARFSPDGKLIAFYGKGENGWYDIYLMDKEGRNIRNLTNDEMEDYSPTWSPDGKWIAYTGGAKNNYNIWIIHMATGKKFQVTSLPGRHETPVWVD
jgi:TolB protein